MYSRIYVVIVHCTHTAHAMRIKVKGWSALRRVMAIPHGMEDVHLLHFEKEGGGMYLYIGIMYIYICIYVVCTVYTLYI